MELIISAFSDTHNKHRKMELPECDLAIFSGDFSTLGYRKELRLFLSWLSKQTQCKKIVFIAGNHDRCFDRSMDITTGADIWLQDMLTKFGVNTSGVDNDSRLIYLENSSINLFGLNIWGSPITPDFDPTRWAFNKPRGRSIKLVWDSIPDNTDIVITHGPPANILDFVNFSREYVGCKDLAERIREVKPKLHVFGHIHENFGIQQHNDTLYCNAAVLDHYAYTLMEQPHKIILNV